MIAEILNRRTYMRFDNPPLSNWKISIKLNVYYRLDHTNIHDDPNQK